MLRQLFDELDLAGNGEISAQVRSYHALVYRSSCRMGLPLTLNVKAGAAKHLNLTGTEKGFGECGSWTFGRGD
eukprot:SAG11_NODE_4654_length_1820_cov_0.908193_2_plen_73_part_00